MVGLHSACSALQSDLPHHCFPPRRASRDQLPQFIEIEKKWLTHFYTHFTLPAFGTNYGAVRALLQAVRALLRRRLHFRSRASFVQFGLLVRCVRSCLRAATRHRAR
jgi:hypothetical protein